MLKVTVELLPDGGPLNLPVRVGYLEVKEMSTQPRICPATVYRAVLQTPEGTETAIFGVPKRGRPGYTGAEVYARNIDLVKRALDVLEGVRRRRAERAGDPLGITERELSGPPGSRDGDDDDLARWGAEGGKCS